MSLNKTSMLLILFLLCASLSGVFTPGAEASVSLTNGYVTPVTGDVTTTFYYYATFYDSSGLPPEIGCVVIDGSSTQIMSLWNGVPSNGVYRYSTTLSEGTHNYYFWFNPGSGGTIYLGYPSAPYSGPTVSPLQRRLTVSGADHGNPNPPNGDWYFNDGQLVWCTVTSPVTEGGLIWTCTGWTGTGSVQSSGSGSATSFTIMQDSSITWHWTSSVPTHTLTVYSDHGNPVPSVGPHTYDDGDPVSCSVTSPVIESGITYACTGWSGTGSVPASGTGTSTETFIMHQSSTITWNWQTLQPDFDVQVDPSQLNIERDSSDTTAVYVISTNGFDEDVSLSVVDIPAGISPSFSTNPVHPPLNGQAWTTLTFSVAPSVPLGTYHPRVVGTSGAITHDFIIELEVTGIDVTWEMVNEQDNRVTPGDRVEYSIAIHNYMEIPMNNVKVCLASYSPTPLGIEIAYKSQYDYFLSKSCDSINPHNYGSTSWQLQVWKTVNMPFYPGQVLPYSNILDQVPLGSYEVALDVEWEDENGLHQLSDSIPITVEHSNFGPPPSGYEHYIQGSIYFHPTDLTVKYAVSKAISAGNDGESLDAADNINGALWSLFSFLDHYFIVDTNPLFKLYGGRIADTEILLKMKQGNPCGQCSQSASITVSLLRAIGIPARLVDGFLWANWGSKNWPWVKHAWAETYHSTNWVHMDTLQNILTFAEPFSDYVDEPWCSSVSAWAMKVTDCPEWTPWSVPNYMSCVDSHWEDVSSKYNPPSAQKTGNLIAIQDPEQFLALDVYDSMGRHVSFDFDTNRTSVNIPGAYYIVGLNFSFIFLPPNINNFDITVDARYAEHPTESYNLTVTIIINSTVADEATCQSTINAFQMDGYHVQIEDQTLAFSPGIHAIGIPDAKLTKTCVGKDCRLPVRLNLTNYGDFEELVNVTIYANATVIGMLENIVIENGTNHVLVAYCDTTGLAYGNYTVAVTVTPPDGEMVTEDNTFIISQEAFVTLPGDVDWDRDVDIFDIVRMADVYGVELLDPSYDPNCDIDGDGDIDIFDIVAAASHYGESW